MSHAGNGTPPLRRVWDSQWVIRGVTKRAYASRVVHNTTCTGLYISVSKSPKQHKTLETLILFWRISKIKYMLYSPPPKLEIAGLPWRWVALLIRDINNMTFTSTSSTELLIFEWHPGERAVCSSCWIFPAQNASKHIKKKKKLSFSENGVGEMFLVWWVCYFSETYWKRNAHSPRQTTVIGNCRAHQEMTPPPAPGAPKPRLNPSAVALGYFFSHSQWRWTSVGP